jgi:hypothetical protein
MKDWGFSCDGLVSGDAWGDPMCGTYCGACGPGGQAADANHAQCNAWTLTAHEDGWGDAILHIQDEDGAAQIVGFNYADDDWVAARHAGICFHPARCYRLTVEGLVTARWSLIVRSKVEMQSHDAVAGQRAAVAGDRLRGTHRAFKADDAGSLVVATPRRKLQADAAACNGQNGNGDLDPEEEWGISCAEMVQMEDWGYSCDGLAS